MLEIKNVYKTFNAGTVNEKVALKGLDLTLEDGDFVTVIGGNGAGKSTMLNAVAGVWPVDMGKIIIDGKDVTRLSEHQRAKYIGRVFQDPMMGTAPSMWIEENLALAARRGQRRGLSWGVTKEEKEQYRELLKSLDLGLENRLTARVGLLSGGQRQRVALGRAMVRNPAVFLLDEPLSNLDAKLRTSMRTEIIKLHKKLATTFIYVTHDQTEAMTMGDRIVVMKDGMIQQVDTPQNLYDYPCNIFVAGFIGSPQMNFLDGTLQKSGDQYTVDLAGTTIPLPKEKTADGKLDAYVGKTLKVGIRPEDIKDDEEFLEKHPNSHLNAEVEVSELMGAEIYLYLTYQGQNLMARVAPTSKSRRGDKIVVAMDTNKIHLFDPESEKTLLN